MEQTFSTKGICPSQIVVQVEGIRCKRYSFAAAATGTEKGLPHWCRG